VRFRRGRGSLPVLSCGRQGWRALDPLTRVRISPGLPPFLFLRLVCYRSVREQFDLNWFAGLELGLCLETVVLAGLGRSQDGPRYIAGTVLSMLRAC